VPERGHPAFSDWSLRGNAMQLALELIRSFPRNDEGQDLLEYGLLMALIGIFAMGAITMLGTTIFNVFWAAIAAASV
jgi:Flp pilus assembly pilin Flp